MCFNVSVSKDRHYLEHRFGAKFEEDYDFKPIYHASAFDFDRLPCITSREREAIQPLTWGLIPSWTKDRAKAKELRVMTGNAKSETIFEKPSFREPISSGRCLVLVDGFFEWQAVEGKKYPWYIHMPDGGAFALAGIYDTWSLRKEDTELRTFSVITSRANPLLEEIHNTKKRMPVILPRKLEKRWLKQNLERGEIEGLMAPYNGELDAYTVKKLVSIPGADKNVPEVLEKKDYVQLRTKQSTLF